MTKDRHPKKKLLVWIFAIGFSAIGIAAMALGVALFYLGSRVEQGFLDIREAQPTLVYSDALILTPGPTQTEEVVRQHLELLQYLASTDLPTSPGQYSIKKHGADITEMWIYTRPFSFPYSPFWEIAGLKNSIPFKPEVAAKLIRLLFQKKALIEMTEQKRKRLNFAVLEPAPIAQLSDNDLPIRTFVSLDEIPTELVQSVIAIEDPRFLEHTGIDPKGLIRAFLKNLISFKISQGGSTITQQLAKNMFLTNRKTYTRKLIEALIALIIESRYTKEQILERYLNEIFYAQVGNSPVIGVKEGANYYFGKELKNLDLSECAFLAGVIRGPYYYQPMKYPDRAIQRRNKVLNKLLELKIISEEEYKNQSNKPLQVSEQSKSLKQGSYLIDAVKEEFREALLKAGIDQNLYKKGLKIYTSIHPAIQSIAEEVIEKEAKIIEDRLIRDPSNLEDEALNLEALLYAISPRSGYVRAIVGGRDYQKSNYNRVLNSKRQPGSTFKPIVYLSSFSEKDENGIYFSPSYKISDERFELSLPNGSIWSPENFEGEGYLKEVSLRQALSESRNVATARLAQKVGIEKIISTAKALGITTKLPPYYSISLGSVELSPIELATAYSTIANFGLYVKPRIILAITSSSGTPLLDDTYSDSQRIPPEETALLIDMLKTVVESGTAKRINTLEINSDIAGKTGTTNDYRDSWFVGFNPKFLALTWVGFDKIPPDHPYLQQLKLSGASAALKIWIQFFKKAWPLLNHSHQYEKWPLLEPVVGLPFQEVSSDLSDLQLALTLSEEEKSVTPPALIQLEIDSETGKLYNSACLGEPLLESFIPGKEPKKSCPRPPSHY